MRAPLPLSLLALASLSLPSLSSLSALSSPPASAPAADVVPGEVLVQLVTPAKADDDARAALRDIGRRHGLALALVQRSLSGWVLARADVDARVVVARIEGDKDVRAAEPHVVVTVLRVADDARRDELWAFDAIELDAAWDVTVGADGQRVGVVDTGTRRDHVDLASKDAGGFDFVRNPWDAIDGNGRDADYSDEGGDTEFHGTHVAGTLLARANDGAGVPGVNWRAELVTVRALGADGSGTLLDVVEGAAWLAGIEVYGAPLLDEPVGVINLSIASDAACGQFERDVYGEILARGIVLVAAAGNAGNDAPTGAPANCPGVIAVGAVDADLALADYSSFDARVDVLAPGGDDRAAENGILSADGADPHGHKVLVGTSMAAPLVAGVASLMRAVNPALTPAQVREILRSSPYTCAGCDDHAFLQADDAVERARPAAEAVVPDDDVTVVCDAQRGNWDCPAGTGCVGGRCEDGLHGAAALGEPCADDTACDSGLCDRAVCTRPCDDGCGAGRCADGVVPGGVCRFDDEAPEGCASTQPVAAGGLLLVGLAVRARRRR